MCLIHHRSALLAALVLASSCVPLLSGQAQEQATVLRSPHRWLDPTVKEEYKKWLREDVAWIITSQERAAFKNLLTDQQRDEFVIAFWEQRNPTPGATENKEEHYRRLAYANQHFAEGIPGWKSDRGRIYITYGQPDKVDHHQDTTESNHSQHLEGVQENHFAFEDWRYRYIEGIGRDVTLEFVDTCRCGEFHLTVHPPTKD